MASTSSKLSFGPYTAVMSKYYSIGSLPVLDLGDRQGSTDYIDFLTDDDMVGGPVQVYYDKFSRPGFALHLTYRDDFSDLEKGVYWKKGEYYILCPFQRFGGLACKWSYGWGESKSNMGFNLARLEDDTEKGYYLFAGGIVSDVFLDQVLSGTHPHVKLV